mmetsp:Transcript_46207/g.90994  ORF Transcript_46207/g.90994 Transcript_46207/m.90994 type:complete len:201 (-) Transcript_46207:511-1113(-)
MSLTPHPSYRKPNCPRSCVLHVYDVSNSETVAAVNQIIKPFGAGAYHSGLEIYGAEWSFGGTEDGSSGIFCLPPTSCPEHSFRESIQLGETKLSEEEVAQVIKGMEDWSGGDYHLLEKNCCHFTTELAKKLGCQPVPPWVNSLASKTNEMANALAKAAKDHDLAGKTNAVIDAAAAIEKGFFSMFFGKSKKKKYPLNEYC